MNELASKTLRMIQAIENGDSDSIEVVIHKAQLRPSGEATRVLVFVHPGDIIELPDSPEWIRNLSNEHLEAILNEEVCSCDHLVVIHRPSSAFFDVDHLSNVFERIPDNIDLLFGEVEDVSETLRDLLKTVKNAEIVLTGAYTGNHGCIDAIADDLEYDGFKYVFISENAYPESPEAPLSIEPS